MLCSNSKGQSAAYLPDVLHVGLPETSYKGSALFTCLLAVNRAGVRDLNAANIVFVYQEGEALNTKHSELPHEQQLPGIKQPGQGDRIGIRL